jgi:hypothetical protein
MRVCDGHLLALATNKAAAAAAIDWLLKEKSRA